MTGVAGGVKRKGMLIVVGEDAQTGVTEEVGRDMLGTVVAAVWLPVIDVEMVGGVDTGGL